MDHLGAVRPSATCTRGEGRSMHAVDRYQSAHRSLELLKHLRSVQGRWMPRSSQKGPRVPPQTRALRCQRIREVQTASRSLPKRSKGLALATSCALVATFSARVGTFYAEAAACFGTNHPRRICSQIAFSSCLTRSVVDPNPRSLHYLPPNPIISRHQLCMERYTGFQVAMERASSRLCKRHCEPPLTGAFASLASTMAFAVLE